MSIILKNATFIHWQTLEQIQTSLKVETGSGGGYLLLPSDLQGVDISQDEVIDCTGKLVTKAFAVGHHHVYSALARGMPVPPKQPENFLEILEYVWWNLDKALDKDMIEASALATAMACAKAGSTFVIDHHASPNAIKGSLEIIANAFDRVGVSHLLCYEISDRDGHEKAQLGLQETEEYLNANQGLVGLHASFTVGDETLKKAVNLMEKTNSGIHIHVAEDLADQLQCEREHNMRVVERLHQFGVLNAPKTILAHCLHLSENERSLIRNSPAWIVENAESNLNNHVGHFRGTNLGKNIMMGTDGMHSDMLRSAQAAFFAGQEADQINVPEAYRRFRNVHYYIADNHFAGDGDNNLVVLDYDSPTPVTAKNFQGHFVFGLSSNHIQHVISNGSWLVKNKRLTKVDEKAILAYTKEQALRLWDRL
ncbi:MAG: amidohydrolase family protein [Bacteroidales bacterium]|jgi:cytosine/adenosine deaminase-related metal-dependent hydrolase